MDAKELLRFQLDDAGNQVAKTLEGLDGIKWDTKMREDVMSPKEVVAHLTECYIAARKHADGEKHEWGSYLPETEDAAALVDGMWAERRAACDALLSKGDEDSMKAATSYIVLHDAYHAGQLAALRMQLTPDWDPYSIYS